ncbi:MAG TPA: class I SAM-dependent methyltransferase [Thiotrichaceae bacterium]|jgi:SAM-dependent methyltransferase|nr:class I SAM-dependent methyltransferase [Thiotrichaceae bacterium]HIM08095.1 class I SAM-dependent methyltransferase [Gammaproteobacteria bacterium]
MEDRIFKDMFDVEKYHWWFVARRKIIANVIKNLGLPNISKILDVGCGNGDNLALLSGFGEVIAIEKESDAIERARLRKSGKVYEGALPDNLPDSLGADFDLIVLLDVLEHIDDDSGSLTSVRKLISENGKLLITVPAFQWLWTNRDKLHHHKRRYTVVDIRQLLEDSGFEIQYISYFNTFLFPLAILERIKQKIIPPSETELLNMPDSLLNYVLEKIFSMEIYFIRKISFPFGLSVIAVAEKSNT